MNGREKGKINIKNALENRDSALYHRLKSIWLQTKELHEHFKGGHNQWMRHCTMVEDNLSKIISDEEKVKRFSPLELFLLSAASCYHDLGKSIEMKSEKSINTRENIFSNYNKYGLTYPEGKVLEFIIESHRSNEVFEEIPERYPIGNEDINLKLLSALFILADILDARYSKCLIPEIIVEDEKSEKVRFLKLFQGWYFDSDSEIALIIVPEEPNDIKIIEKGFSFMKKQIEFIAPVLKINGFPFKITYFIDTKKNKSTHERNVYGTQTTFVHDTPSEIDCIWGNVYSKALADFITHEETKPPLVIGINAPWGTGKTSLMKLLQKQIDSYDNQQDSNSDAIKMTLWDLFNQLRGKKNLDKDQKLTDISNVRFPTIWFNAWKYSKEEQLWAGLMQSIIRQLTDRMGKFEKEQFFLRLNMKRIDVDKIRNSIYQSILSDLAPRLILCLITFIPTYLYFFQYGSQEIWPSIGRLFYGQDLFGGSFILLNLLTIGAVVKKFADTTFNKPLSLKFSDYVKEPKYEKKIGFIDEVEEDFKRVQDSLIDQKLVIFIDDLDRCPLSKIVEVIEATNVIFGSDHSKCIFVIGIDDDIIAASIECAYSPVVQAMGSKHCLNSSFGRQFLQKIVQVSFTLPEPKNEQLKSYFNSIISGKQGIDERIVTDDKLKNTIKDEIRQKSIYITDVENVVQEKREKLSHDEQLILDEAARDVAVEMITEKDPKVQEVLENALHYLEKKPRQMKRFLNLFRLTTILNIRQQGPLSMEDLQQVSKGVAISMRYPEFTKKVQFKNKSFAELENAACDDSVWVELLNRPEWKGIIDGDMQEILKSGVKLSNSKIDFSTLV